MTSIEPIQLVLNTEQQRVYDACIEGSSSIFCTGQGGTGKSLLLSSIVKSLKNVPNIKPESVAVTASTGVAAYHVHGTTLHRFSGTGIEESDLNVMIQKTSKPRIKNQWLRTQILIIDEVSMLSATLFNNLSALAKHLRQSEEPFGGIRLLMFGDFLQLPPVARRKQRVPRIFESEAWKELNPTIFELNQVIRQSDERFRNILDELRLGSCSLSTEAYIQTLSRELPSIDDIEPVKLYATKQPVDTYNLSRLHRLDSQSQVYTAVDSGAISVLNQCPAPKMITLKKGAQVMLIRNLSSNAVNGSVGTITDFSTIGDSKTAYPVVSMILPDGTKRSMHIQPVDWTTELPNGSVVANRIQIPLVLAWALTIHKSQGQTIPLLTVDMKGIFEYGQAYVALSRCINPDSMQVLNFSRGLVRADNICVGFYCKLRSQNHQTPATNVASDTSISWEDQTANTIQQLNSLSLDQISPHSE